MEPKPETSPLPLITTVKLDVGSYLLDISIRPDGTFNKTIFNLIDLIKSPTTPTFVNGVKSYDVTIDPDRNLWFRVFVPDVTADQLPVMVYFHGGGFALLSPDSIPIDGLCRRFSSMIHAVVVCASYRLTPEHRYPAQYDDGIDVLKFLDENRDKLPENADLGRCFVSGDSSGGNISHHVCIRASQNNFQQLKVIGQVALQPFFGGEKRTASELSPENSKVITLKHTDFFWSIFMPLGEEWDRDNEVINVSGPRAADISRLDFPATLVVVGGRDILQDWQRKYYEWLKKSGKEAYLEEYKYMFHTFYLFTELDEATHVISVIADFVNKRVNASDDQ